MDFIQLFDQLDQTTKTSLKIQAIYDYLVAATESDKIYVVSLLMGQKPKRAIKTTDLRIWAAEIANIPLWLFEESYYVVGDLAESLALVLPEVDIVKDYSVKELYIQIIELKKLDAAAQRVVVEAYWASLTGTGLFLFNKLLTGNFRVGVSKKIVVKALAKYLEQEEAGIEHRLMGKWDPQSESLTSLFDADKQGDKNFLPYPFFLAYPLEQDITTLGPLSDWILEAKLDGIRGQLIVREGELFVWSRGEELMTDKFPEFDKLRSLLPSGTVLDGEIIPWLEDAPLDFALMQTRIGRKNLTAKILKEVPLILVCYDLLEWEGKDMRAIPLDQRRALLAQVLQDYKSDGLLRLSQRLEFNNWEEAESYRIDARLYQSEGLMIKHINSPYGVGRKRGSWWKFKTAPMTVDAVMIYAQAGHGRRANLFTDYTFAVWDGDQLVPFAKAYSGLTDKELIQIDNWIKRHTLAKFGPIRSVKAELIFEIAFEGINLSSRHKSGIALRFPRILRWRKDKPLAEINTKQDLLNLIQSRQ